MSARTHTNRSQDLVLAAALLFTGLLAGTFSYASINIAPTFQAVPLDVRLVFHSELMKMNGPVMQTAMALAILSSTVLAIVAARILRRLAAGAAALGVATFAITRFGNVPINRQIRDWVVAGPPPGYAELLQRWDLFNYARTLTALTAFLLIIVAVQQHPRPTARASDLETANCAVNPL